MNSVFNTPSGLCFSIYDVSNIILLRFEVFDTLRIGIDGVEWNNFPEHCTVYGIFQAGGCVDTAEHHFWLLFLGLLILSTKFRLKSS